MVIAGEGNFRDNERWLSRARASPSCFSGWNHSANAAPKHSIRLNMLATPLFKYPIRLDMPIPSPPKHPPPIGMLAMGEKRVQCRWHRLPPHFSTGSAHCARQPCAIESTTPMGLRKTICGTPTTSQIACGNHLAQPSPLLECAGNPSARPSHPIGNAGNPSAQTFHPFLCADNG